MNEIINECDEEEAKELIGDVSHLDITLCGGDVELMKNMLLIYYAHNAVTAI